MSQKFGKKVDLLWLTVSVVMVKWYYPGAAAQSQLNHKSVDYSKS